MLDHLWFGYSKVVDWLQKSQMMIVLHTTNCQRKTGQTFNPNYPFFSAPYTFIILMNKVCMWNTMAPAGSSRVIG